MTALAKAVRSILEECDVAELEAKAQAGDWYDPADEVLLELGPAEIDVSHVRHVLRALLERADRTTQ